MGKKFPDYVPPTQIAWRDEGATLHLRKCHLSLELKDGSWRDCTFDQSVVTLGAMDDNDVVLRDDTVSRYHCRIIQEGNAYVVQDLSSTNGTFINMVRIKEAYLKPGCTLSLGKSRILFKSIDEKVRIKPSADDRFGGIIGANRHMRQLYGILERIAPTDTTIVIEGETGTGKEVVAQTIHARSKRKDAPFIVFDCSAVPEALIESELFGHEKGSFTGAIMARKGLFELAHGGTLFLDELGELSLELQPKLLRALESREIRRVGGTRTLKVDARVIAATNRKLDEMVREGRFRQDLYYRLSVVRLQLPPLRERQEDVPLLVQHFLREARFNRRPDGTLRINTISREALDALQAHPWPGNVRELLNTVERACSFADGDLIELEHLPSRFIDHEATLERPVPAGPGPVDPDQPFKQAKERWVSSFESDYIELLLEKHGFNISHAAREAEIDRKYFRKLMKKHGIDAASRRS